MDYPIALAGFLPVIALAAGVALLVPRIGHPAMAVGGVSAVVGAGSQAAGKLVTAWGGPDIDGTTPVLLLNVGLMLMGWALVMTSPDEPWLPGPLFALMALLCVLVGIAVSTLLVVMLTVTLVGLGLLARAHREKAKPAAFLFGFFLFGGYVTGALWSRPGQTVALQWAGVAAEILTWSAFALGARLLTRTRIPKATPRDH